MVAVCFPDCPWGNWCQFWEETGHHSLWLTRKPETNVAFGSTLNGCSLLAPLFSFHVFCVAKHYYSMWMPMRMPPPGPVIRMVRMHNWRECVESNEMVGLLCAAETHYYIQLQRLVVIGWAYIYLNSNIFASFVSLVLWWHLYFFMLDWMIKFGLKRVAVIQDWAASEIYPNTFHSCDVVWHEGIFVWKMKW